MMKRSYKLLCLGLLIVCTYVYADDTCIEAYEEAKQNYSAGNFEKAKALFEFVKEVCGSNYGEVNAWISKCNSALTPSLSLSRTSLSFGSTPNSSSISVTSNRSWCVQSSGASWISTSVNGNSIKVSCLSNSSTSSRSTYFDVKTTDGTKSVRVKISQSGPTYASSNSSSSSQSRQTFVSNNSSGYLDVDKESISSSSYGTTEYIKVSSNVEWMIQHEEGTMYTATKNGDYVSVVIKPNTGSSARTDYFIIISKDKRFFKKISLSQSYKSTSTSSSTSTSTSTDKHYGFYPSFYVNETSFYVSCEGGYFKLPVYGDGSVYFSSAWTNKNWLEEERLSEGGKYFHVKKNLSLSDRYGELYLKDSRGRKITIYVRQAGKGR